jgi:hypothetical protein
MSLKIVAGKLELLSTSIVCQLSDERQALRDLADYHFGEALPDVAAFGGLLLEIERLANAKFHARRSEENGELVIACADVLLYGFEAAGQMPPSSSRENESGTGLWGPPAMEPRAFAINNGHDSTSPGPAPGAPTNLVRRFF